MLPTMYSCRALFSLNFIYPAGFISVRVMRVTCVPRTSRSDHQYQTRLPKHSGPASPFRIVVTLDTAFILDPASKIILGSASPFSENCQQMPTKLTHAWNLA